MVGNSQGELERGHRTRWLVIVGGVAGLAAVSALGLLSITLGTDDGGPTRGDAYRGSEPPVRIEIPPFALRSYHGGTVTSASLRGRVVLLTLLDSQCTDACPILASVIARTVDRLTKDERSQVTALAITVDPAEDTPSSVTRFLTARRAVGRLDYLIGPEIALRPLWESLQVLPSVDSGFDNLHSAPLRIYDRNGVLVATLHAGADLTQDNALHDIRRALRAADDT